MASIQGDDGIPSGFVPNAPYGVWGDSGRRGNGVVGSSAKWSGVAGFTLSNDRDSAGVFGSGVVGVTGFVRGGGWIPHTHAGVFGSAVNLESSEGGIGVLGYGDNAGVRGDTLAGAGVHGESTLGAGVEGFTTNGVGVMGVSIETTGIFGVSRDIGVVGWGDALAALFLGDVRVTGNVMKGGGGFAIDHPLDPANKYLQHSFVESPEMKNLYDGVITCDAKGEAVVKLPDWFEALNSDYRYQLTPIGAAAPGLYIASGVKNGCFKIRGGKKGLKVSWQVTGTRKDAWAKKNRIVVEPKKTGKERGKYLHPEAHRAPSKAGIHHAVNEKALEQLKLAAKAKRKPKLKRGKR